MLNDGGSIAAALSPTMLGGRKVYERPGFEPAERIFAVPCDAGEVAMAWRAARDQVVTTGRWPVL